MCMSTVSGSSNPSSTPGGGVCFIQNDKLLFCWSWAWQVRIQCIQRIKYNLKKIQFNAKLEIFIKEILLCQGVNKFEYILSNSEINKTKRCKTVYPHCLIKCIKNGVQKVGKRTQKKKERKKERKKVRKKGSRRKTV